MILAPPKGGKKNNWQKTQRLVPAIVKQHLCAGLVTALELVLPSIFTWVWGEKTSCERAR